MTKFDLLLGPRGAYGPQAVRKKFGRDRFSPTTSNGPANAFPQVRRCFPAATGDDQRSPIPSVIVPLQRLALFTCCVMRWSGDQIPRAGQHSIRINEQWRICFRWTDAGGAEDVEIVHYH